MLKFHKLQIIETRVTSSFTQSSSVSIVPLKEAHGNRGPGFRLPAVVLQCFALSISQPILPAAGMTEHKTFLDMARTPFATGAATIGNVPLCWSWLDQQFLGAVNGSKPLSQPGEQHPAFSRFKS